MIIPKINRHIINHIKKSAVEKTYEKPTHAHTNITHAERGIPSMDFVLKTIM